MPLGPVHSDFSELCQCWPPSGPNRGARIGLAILTLRSPPPGRLGCSHVGEPNGLEPQEPPEEGPHHARRVETYSLADGRSPSLPHGPDTVMSGFEEVGGHDPYQASPVPPALAVAAAHRAQAPGATALLRGRWRPAAVRHGRSAMCRIGQDLKPPPRMPSQDRVRAWGLRGHLPHAARPSLSQAAPVAASRGLTRGS